MSGCVIDPDGKAVRGAKIVFTYGASKNVLHRIWAVSAADGRFTFALPVKAVTESNVEEPKKGIYVVAAAEGYGFAAARLELDKLGADELMLRLVKDDVPIRGRIIDLQGQPVAGVRVRIEHNLLSIFKKGELTGWLVALKAGKVNYDPVKW